MRRILARSPWWGLGLGLLALALFFVVSVQQAQPVTAALAPANAGSGGRLPAPGGRLAAYPGPSDTPGAYPAPATATLPPPGSIVKTPTPTATSPAYPGPVESPAATLPVPAYPGPVESPTATLPPPAYPGPVGSPTATLPPPAYPGPTRTATLAPPATHTPVPYPGATLPPYPALTATSTAQTQAFACDENDPTNICHGVVKTTVYIDYRCNRVFDPTVDTLLSGVGVQVRLDDGRTLSGVTDAYGEAFITGVQVTRSHPAQVRVAKPTPPQWVVDSGLMLVPCGNSPSVWTLTDGSFSLEQRTNAAFRFAVQ